MQLEINHKFNQIEKIKGKEKDLTKDKEKDLTKELIIQIEKPPRNPTYN